MANSRLINNQGGMLLNSRNNCKILRVDLSDRSFREEDVSPELIENYIGGAGFGIKYLYNELPAGVAAFDPTNKLIFAVGPLTATGTPCTSRMAVCSKSPLTGTIACALAGGHYPAEIRRAGYIMIVIEGKSPQPVYISINDGDVRFHNAERIHGMLTSDTQNFIKEDLRDETYRIACTGPAGDNLVPIACVVNERRAAGRKGLGAVMGSKNLKAIAVKGTQKPEIADPAAFSRARKEMLKVMRESAVLFPEFSQTGTPSNVDAMTRLGILPSKNWSTTGEKNYVPSLGVEAQKSFIVGRNFCTDCPVGCSQIKMVKEGPYAGYMTEGPEYESCYALGTVVGVDYLPALIAADRLCDEFGLDTISTGVSIAFAMELFERGIIKAEDADGTELKFGDHAQMIALIRKIAYKEGFGAVLAQGTRKAAEQIGKGADKFAMQIKGLELPAYDVRSAKAHGLNYATAYCGADHNRGYSFQEIFGVPVPEPVDRFSIKGKAYLTKWNQDVRCATTDCPTICAFILDMALAGIACRNVADLVSAVTGISMDETKVQRAGERINNIARLFNIREGFTRQHDTLPKRLMQEAIKKGASEGERFSPEDLNRLLDEYYAVRGWDNNGIPTPAKLQELGINYR